MRAVIAPVPGGIEALQIVELPDPVPAPDEVLIDVVATAINRADLLQRAGFYPPPPGASEVLGLECSGRIAALGSEVSGWNVGDEVCALLTAGGYAEKVAVPAGQLMPIPLGVDLVTAAALPEGTCTVHSVIFGAAPAANLQPGETILIHGGTSGIGTVAIQLAAAHGARVFATAGSAEKVAVCRDLGADVAINYREQDFAEVIAGETCGAGVDVILDTIGAKYLPQHQSSLAVGGRIAVIGMLGGVKAELNLAQLMAKRGSIYASSLRSRSVADKASIVARTQAYVWPLIESGTVRPIVHQVLPLSDIAQAHRIVDASTHIGKVVVTVGQL